MKKRADILIFEKGLARSRNQAVELIKTGRVKADEKTVTKNSELLSDAVKIEISGTEVPYVGRGGLKLEGALKEFNISPAGLVVVDVGASTGGFTECLLRQDAKKVYAVDVGTAQLAEKLRTDKRVMSLENTDIRNLPTLPEKIDLVVIDLSFISLELVLAKVAELIKDKGLIITLVKPQFETAKKEKNKSGVVKSDESREKALTKIKEFSKKIGLRVLGEIPSPILGGAGNMEYFLLLQK